MTDRVRVFRVAVLGALLAGSLVACGSGSDGGSSQKASLKVEWVDANDRPGCTYDAPTRTVTAKLSLDGVQPKQRDVELVVTAYADENTSQPVGSKATPLTLEGTVHRVVTVVFPVSKPPQVDVDNVAACSQKVKDS